jgi:hypothetical protein
MKRMKRMALVVVARSKMAKMANSSFLKLGVVKHSLRERQQSVGHLLNLITIPTNSINKSMKNLQDKKKTRIYYNQMMCI